VSADLKGVALVIAATASPLGALLGGLATLWSVKANAAALAAKSAAEGAQVTAAKAHGTAEVALAIIEKVGTDINGRMTQLLATKDLLTEARVDMSLQQGVQQGRSDMVHAMERIEKEEHSDPAK
jgi:hypothetical protein